MSASVDRTPKTISACDYCRLKKSHGEVCHFTPPNRRVQRKTAEAKETQRLLQARLEKAEGLLRQAGLAGYTTQTSPWTGGLNVRSVTEPAPALAPSPAPAAPVPGPSESGLTLNYTLPDSLMGDSRVVIDQRPHNAGIPSRSLFQDDSQPLFNRHLPTTNSATTIDTSTGSARPSPHGPGLEQGTMVVNYSTATHPTVLSPPTSQFASAMIPVTSNEPAGPNDSSPALLQRHSPSFTVNESEPAQSPIEELHGPGSFMSVCCKPGSEWVSRQIGASSFTDSAASFTTRVNRELKMQNPATHARAPDPDPVRARSYAAAYFEQTFESAFDIIDRAWFESRLTAHLERATPDDDPAWYALRNVVYAFGCRATTFREGDRATWREAQSNAWRFFEYAMSVHTELVYFRSNVSAVQALLVMSLFVEGMGNPKLEYMLISTTVRLAQSKSLHLQSPPTSPLPPCEVALRSRLFWAMYFYEKHIAYRAGRPSMINDEDIDCKVPEPAPGQRSAKTDFFHHVIQHAQISSAIINLMTTAKARRREPRQTIVTVNELDRRLRAWYATVPEALRNRASPSGTTPPGLQASSLNFLHLAYLGSLAAIHSVFAYPWNLTGMSFGADVDLSAQVDASTHALAEASRGIILATRQLQISAAAPVWELFLYPVIGMINLFVHILKYPARPSVSSDLGLLQMAAGYFGYLDYATSAIRPFPFIKDIVQLARLATQRVRGSQGSGGDALPAPHTLVDASSYDAVDLSSWDEDLGGFNASEMGLDNWVFFLPSLNQVSSMAMNIVPDDPIDFSVGQSTTEVSDM